MLMIHRPVYDKIRQFGHPGQFFGIFKTLVLRKSKLLGHLLPPKGGRIGNADNLHVIRAFFGIRRIQPRPVSRTDNKTS